MVGPKEHMDKMKDLARNFDKVVEEYSQEKKKELEEGKRSDLLKELEGKKGAVELITSGKVIVLSQN